MNLPAAAVVLALLAPTLAFATPSHAAAGTKCGSQTDLEQRVLVKKRPVETRKGQRFGTLRLFAGVQDTELSPGGAGGGPLPTFCVDLVVADAFKDRHPKYHGQVSSHEGRVQWSFAGRARTGVVASGGGSSIEGETIEVTFVLDGQAIQGRRVMRATFPEVG